MTTDLAAEPRTPGQSVGNLNSGLVSGLPVTSVIVRGSVNINAGTRTRWAVSRGMRVSVVPLPAWRNTIPLSYLAAILMSTGAKPVSPALERRIWGGGPAQLVPFALTVTTIVLTNLLVGVAAGMAAALAFVLRSGARGPLRKVVETHLMGQSCTSSWPTRSAPEPGLVRRCGGTPEHGKYSAGVVRAEPDTRWLGASGTSCAAGRDGRQYHRLD